MLRVGDYVTWMPRFGGTVTGRVTAVGPGSVMVDDGTVWWYCPLEEVHKIETPIPNEDVALDEFDSAHIKEKGVTVAIRNRGPVMDKIDGGMRFKPLDGPAETRFSDGTVIPDEFDGGGLKKMPDGTLESVHIPTEKEAMIPYTATGTGGPPKPKPPALEWKVVAEFGGDPSVSVRLYVDGEGFGSQELGRPEAKNLTARQERKLAKKIAEAKENILRLYRLTLKESGRVE